MYQSQMILEGARVIRHHLPELLGEDAEAFDDRVAALLNSGRDDEEAAQEVLALLSASGATSEWLADFLAFGVSLEKAAEGFETRTFFGPCQDSIHRRPRTDTFAR